MHHPIRARLAPLLLLLPALGCDGLLVPAGDRVEIAAPRTTLLTGEQLPLTATVYRLEARVDTAEVLWTSGDTTVATVSEAGVVTGVNPGSVTLRATAGTASATIDLSVQSRLAEVAVLPVPGPLVHALAPGDTMHLAVRARDAAHGAVVDGVAVRWTSSDPSVAAVDGSGVLHAAGPGSTTVTATVEGVSGSVRVVVTHAYALQPIEIAGVGETRATAIGEAGDVLVSAVGADLRRRGFVWRGGEAVELGDPAQEVEPQGVNGAGEVVGTFLRAGWRRPFLLREGELVDLDPEGARHTRRVAIDDGGTVAGHHDGGEAPGAFVWRDGARTELAPVDGWLLRPLARGTGGRMVGAALRGDERRAFLLEGDSLTLLPGTEATAVAGDGTVVGSAEADGARHAFRWRAGALTGVVGADPGEAVLPASVNASGVAVGTYARFAGSPHPAARAAFAWFAGDALRLERLARHPEWEVVEAAGIDAHGRIAATARHRDTGVERAVLLTPR